MANSYRLSGKVKRIICHLTCLPAFRTSRALVGKPVKAKRPSYSFASRVEETNEIMHAFVLIKGECIIDASVRAGFT